MTENSRTALLVLLTCLAIGLLRLFAWLVKGILERR